MNQSLTDTANLLAALADQAKTCMKCALCKDRTNVVFSSGDSLSPLMFLGEAPGEDEDKAGSPFVGKSGQLLDKMIEKCLPLKREQIYVANVVKCRPPNNRVPQIEEIAQCFGYLQQQIMLVKPRVIVTLGKVATQALLNVEEKIGKMRGKVYHYQEIAVVPTWHPSYLLRRPIARWDSVEDMKVVTNLLSVPG